MAIALFVLLAARAAEGQQSISDVLSFLVTNRSIPTDDFVRDEQAAIATRDTISKLLVLELATLPSSSGGGFTYRLDPSLGTVIRASDSFGPLFTERSLLAGQGRASFGMSFSSVIYDNIDGRNLRDGTLVSTASVFRGETTPFDIETVSLRFRTDTVTLNGTVGITDQFDISAGIPFIRLNLEGQRVDTYRGGNSCRPLVQLQQPASAMSCCAPGTMCIAPVRAEWPSALRCVCRRATKRTCSEPEALASPRGSSARMNRIAWAFMVRSDTRSAAYPRRSPTQAQ
jgi:hypothetical protein